MISPEQFERIAHTLPLLRQAETPVRHEFMQAATLARIPAGRDVFAPGDEAAAIALLISGVVRVYKIGENGREITLYRFGLGDSCILTANAILSQQAFPAIATVEQDAEAVMIAASTFRDWVQRHSLWRDFVFNLLSQRLASVMEIVDEVAFRRMDARVAALLLARGSANGQIRMTHQEIAAELGTSREVVSRILEDFAGARLLELRRGLVSILDAAGLAARSRM